MDLINHLPKELIFTDLRPENKWTLLDQMIDSIANTSDFKRLGVNADILKQTVTEREKQMSTGLGNGIGFPHIRHDGLKTMLISIAVLKKDIDYNSLDEKPVNIVCMVIAPDQAPTLALKVRSCIARMLSNASLREQILQSETAEQIHNIIHQQSMDIDIPITAEDIMNKSTLSVATHTPLKEVTRLMSMHSAKAIAVLDENNKLAGEITCDLLFGFGMPDFFSNLKSVSFISEFDPFEKYFHEESHSVAGHLMSKNFSKMTKKATLLEIVFALTVQKHHKIYIEDNGEFIGEIDQSLVLDRIMRL